MRHGGRRASIAALTLSCAVLAFAAAPQPARAFDPLGTVCGIGGIVSGALGKACSVGGKLLGAGRKLLGGGSSAPPSKAQIAIGLAAFGAWVGVGAEFALHETAKVVSETSSPHLMTTWFSSTYWRMAAIGALLTMPFLFAAAIQALLRSDLTLLLRAALGYLPMALLGVGVAAPITMLLLAATDQMCAVISAAAGNAGVHFLWKAGGIAGALSVVSGSPFIAFLSGLVAALGAIALWLELLMREAAVYVVVLMLPLAFAALVWPARRVWAIRAVELLVALILSKFAIVAVLSLGGAALDQGPFGGVTSMLAGGVLVILGAFAPWALIRLLPLAELASGAAGALSSESWRAGRALTAGGGAAEAASARLTGAVQRSDAEVGGGPEDVARSQRDDLAELPAPPVAPGGGGEPDAGVSTGGGGERLPGLPPAFQAKDFDWKLHLGLENFPPAPLGPLDLDEPVDRQGPTPPQSDGRGEL